MSDGGIVSDVGVWEGWSEGDLRHDEIAEMLGARWTVEQAPCRGVDGLDLPPGRGLKRLEIHRLLCVVERVSPDRSLKKVGVESRIRLVGGDVPDVVAEIVEVVTDEECAVAVGGVFLAVHEGDDRLQVFRRPCLCFP